MTVEVSNNPRESRYEARLDGELAGFVQYRMGGEHIILFHTAVAQRFQGQGIGDRLAAATLDGVRRQGLGLIPSCPFIASYIRRHPDRYLDLVLPSLRDRVMQDDRSAARPPSG